MAALEEAERKQRDELESLLDELRALIDAAPAETVIAESDVEALAAFGSADTAPGLGFAPVPMSPNLDGSQWRAKG